MTPSNSRFTAKRQALLAKLFPSGVPPLWCPLLTHYRDDGSIDSARIGAHIRHLYPAVRGLLVPGTTGDAWELDDREIRTLIECVIGEVVPLRVSLLIGVLRPDTETILRTLADTMKWLKLRTGADDNLTAMARSGVCGFTICPPSGQELDQQAIQSSLEAALQLGFPMAIYQLPQVTKNEMSPALVAELVERFDNFYLLKDTSGQDRVALAGVNGIFLVRGAEGNYTQHLAGNGGRYDGFLLSTANCFGKQLAEVIEAGHGDDLAAAAETFSLKLGLLFDELAARAVEVPWGNPFANANKAMDHFFAYGPGALSVSPPMLHAKHRMPRQLIEAASTALTRHGLMPMQGYLS